MNPLIFNYRIINEGADFDKADRFFDLLKRKIDNYRKRGNVYKVIIPNWVRMIDSSRLFCSSGGMIFGCEVEFSNKNLISVLYD